MSKEINYKIFSESHQDPFYILQNPEGNHLFFSRHDWAECKLIMNREDLVKIHVMKYKPLVIALEFTFEITLNNMVFSVPNLNKFKIKGNYFSNKTNEINWKWKTSCPSRTEFTLIDKKNKGKKLAKIKDFTLGSGLSLKGELTGSITIFDGIPSEFHNIIIVSGCLVYKELQEYQHIK